MDLSGALRPARYLAEQWRTVGPRETRRAISAIFGHLWRFPRSVGPPRGLRGP